MEKFKQIIASPINKQKLSWNEIEHSFVLEASSEKYFLENGIFDFIPSSFYESKKFKDWKHFQEAYKKRNEGTKKVGTERQQKYVRYHQEFLNNFCDLSGRMLDVGCGPMLKHFESFGMDIIQGLEYIGIDPEKELLLNNRNCLCAVGEMLPFIDESFDCATLISVIDHVVSPMDVMKEVKRVLKKGGVVYLSVPIRTPGIRVKWKRFFQYGFRGLTMFIEFDQNSIKKLLKKVGLEIGRSYLSKENPKQYFIEAKKK